MLRYYLFIYVLKQRQRAQVINGTVLLIVFFFVLLDVSCMLVCCTPILV